jgi:hypothetical protein
MQESCTYGSVRGAPSNGCPYRDREIGLAECVAVGAAQPIETAGGSDLARILGRDNARETESFSFPVDGSPR